MRRSLFALILISALPGLSAATAVPKVDPSRVVDIRDRIMGASLDAAKAAGDTVYIFGGPGTLEGKFEAAGLPDDQGWTGVDLTEMPPDLWKQHTFNAANLDTLQPDNHAWWCGDLFPVCTPEDSVLGYGAGYGNGWDTRLTWTATVPDPDSTTTVTVQASLNHDTEAAYDYLVLGVELSDGGVDQVLWFEGTALGVQVDETFEVGPGSYRGPMLDELKLVWRFVSDTGWSDEDCNFTSHGAVQIDNIKVLLDGVQVGATETCEPGAPSSWVAENGPSVGDFAKIWPALEDADRCFDNHTPALAFIDDGEVVPGTGGYLCQTYCYGPGGYVVNPEGGLAGPDYDIYNFFVSPDIAVPDMTGKNMEVAWDVFRHNLVGLTGIFYMWEIQSTSDPDGLAGWSSWQDRNFFYEGGPYWDRHSEIVGDLLVPDARWLRLRLGVIESNVCGSENTDGTPAPYFDNVAVKVFGGNSGPVLSTYESNLAQDGFPASGLLDFGTFSAHRVRFDMARDLNAYLWDGSGINPGDSVTVRADLPGDDWDFVGWPRMYYRLYPNPFYDAYRTSGLPLAGYVEGDSVGYAFRPEFAFDLPDEGFLFPGDQLHYYFQATATNGVSTGTSILPADTTGFSSFIDGSGIYVHHYDETFTVRGLPSVRLVEGQPVTPPVLFWDEAASPLNLTAWRLAMAQYGLVEGIDYDTFSSVNPDDARTGLATRATLAQITGYQSILIDAGSTRAAVLDGIDSGSNPNPRPDIDLLTDWLDLDDRRLLIMGDRAAQAISSESYGYQFLTDMVGIDVEGSDLHTYLDDQNEPESLPLAGNPVFGGPGFRIAGCSLRVPVVSLERVLVGSAIPLSEWADPNGAPGAYPYSAGSVNHPDTTANRIAHFPFSLGRLESLDPAEEGSAEARLRFLTSLMQYLNTSGSGQPSPVPSAGVLLAQNWPNPFNPSTTISYDAPRGGQLDIQVFDLGGRLVRSLASREVAAGPGHVVWDGRDAGGRAVSSGVYFCRVALAGDQRLLKLALIK